MKADIVFQGGGVKVLGFIGAICKLEEVGFKWQRFAGTSAGAIIASLLASGYTGEELKKIVYDTDFSKFAKKSKCDYIPLGGKAISLLKNKGVFTTECVTEFISDLYKKKKINKFKDISNNGKSKLKVIASDVTNQRLLILPDDIKEYGINPMELEIAKAVTMSISIPLFFIPQKIKYKDKCNFIVDGGITSNYPIWIFDVKGIPKWPTLGMKLKKNKNNVLNNSGSETYFYDLVETLIDCYDEDYISDKDKVRSITISSLGTRATEFNISTDKKKELIDEGYKSAEKFLKQWNFDEYIRLYRKN